MTPRAPTPTAAPLVPDKASLPSLREAAAGCTACELYKMSEITACKPWLEAEMKVVKPPALELKAFTEDLARVAREL